MNSQDVMDKYESGLRVRITKDEGTMGMMIAAKNLNNRAVGKTGKVKGYAPGHGGDVWWIEHDDGSGAAAYCHTEFEEIASEKVVTISSDWTDKERLAVIQKKAARIMTVLQPPGDPALAFTLTDDVYRLTYASAAFLESNRDRLIDDK